MAASAQLEPVLQQSQRKQDVHSPAEGAAWKPLRGGIHQEGGSGAKAASYFISSLARQKAAWGGFSWNSWTCRAPQCASGVVEGVPGVQQLSGRGARLERGSDRLLLLPELVPACWIFADPQNSLPS